MNFHTILQLINLCSAGILAGIEIAVHYGFHAAITALDEKPQLVLRQGLIRKLRWLVPAFFVPTALSGIDLTIIEGAAPGLVFRLVAIAAIVVWIFVRIVATVRINSATLEWDPDAPPKGWQDLVGKAERFHVFGTWAAILMFVGFLMAMA